MDPKDSLIKSILDDYSAAPNLDPSSSSSSSSTSSSRATAAGIGQSSTPSIVVDAAPTTATGVLLNTTTSATSLAASNQTAGRIIQSSGPSLPLSTSPLGFVVENQPRSPLQQHSAPQRHFSTPEPPLQRRFSSSSASAISGHSAPQQSTWQVYSGPPPSTSQQDPSSLDLSTSSSASNFVSLLRRLSQQGSNQQPSPHDEVQQHPAHVQSGSTISFQGDPINLYHAQSGISTLHPHDALNATHNSPLPTSPISFYTPSPPSYQHMTMSGGSDSSHTLRRGASSGSSGQYMCPNCSKTFARDDLLRRHLAREARAAAQPVLDRQKSCFECARSKARCDLEVPTCGRCRLRGKACSYGARSGNPNVRKNVRSSSGDTIGQPSWSSNTPSFDAANPAQAWNAARHPGPSHGGLDDSQGGYHFGRQDAGSNTEDESDDSHAWSESYRSGLDSYTRSDRSNSGGQGAAFEYHHSNIIPQHHDPLYAPFNGTINPQHGPSSYHHHHPSIAIRAPGIDTGVARTQAEEDEATPVNRNAVMGPPLVTPTRSREGEAGQSISARPQVPRLLTGARMPRPHGEAGQVSARPLFSAQLDLSGWLEEPVIPSPLYRMGPSLSALGASASQPYLLPTPTITTAHNQALLAAASTATTSVQQDSLQHQEQRSAANVSASQHAQTAALNWWAAGPQERSAVDAQEVAQACAGHFTLYPGLMVLPDATSPVPPLFHRPWLAFSRLQTPAALAQVRIALAAYHVRLPASETMVWDMIRAQASSIVSSYDAICQSSDMEVFSATAALWFLVILLLMSTDPNSGLGVDESMTDTCLIGLSHLARLLLQRLQARERADKQGNGGLSGGDDDAAKRAADSSSSSSSFLQWGFVETMRRTLFACYALFVLQRFRATSPELQSQLAGAELVLDVNLPATASEFEAGDDLEWRAAQHVKITDEKNKVFGDGQALTLRTLLQARSEAAAAAAAAADQQRQSGDDDEQATTAEDRKKAILAYFDRHDDFTNVCLTVSFGLDTRI